MALTLSNLLKSPQFLCKQVKFHPPTAVVCYAHSQLAVQACKVEKPIIFLLEKEKKPETRKVSVKNIQDAQWQLQIQCHRRGKASIQVTEMYQAVNAMWDCVRTLEMQQKLVDKSLLTKWNHDPLLDHKQLVLLLFDQDNLSNKPCFSGKKNLKLKQKTSAKEKVMNEQTYLTSEQKSCTETVQVSRVYRSVENMSHSKLPVVDSTSEATVLYTDDTAKPDMKKDFRMGPDPTQLSSVLLGLRDEIPEFFLKTPDYSIYHQNVKFVNNIIGTTTNGIYQYRAQISGFRMMIVSCMTELSMDVLKISKHPNEGTIKVRWRIKGMPLIRKLVPYTGRQPRDARDCYRYLDGFSVFEVGSDGLIHCHRLHKVLPSSSQEKESPLWMVFLLPFFHLLDPKAYESCIAFECRSTDKGIESGIQV